MQYKSMLSSRFKAPLKLDSDEITARVYAVCL